jgi:hypothetical protein
MKKSLFCWSQFSKYFALVVITLITSSLLLVALPTHARVSGAKTSQWHCLCYKERYKGSVVQATSCRSNVKACKKLEMKVKRGSKAIVAGSLSRRCTAVKASHPEKKLGGVGQWLPSARPGAIWTPSGCFLTQAGKTKSKSSNVSVAKSSLKAGKKACATILKKNGWSEYDELNRCEAFSKGSTATVKIEGGQRGDSQELTLSVDYKSPSGTWSDRRKLSASIDKKWGVMLNNSESFYVTPKRLMLGEQEALHVEVTSSVGEDSYSDTSVSLIYLLDRKKHLIFKGFSGEVDMDPGEEERTCNQKVQSRFRLLNAKTLLQEIRDGCGKNPKVRKIKHRIK